MYRDSLNDVRKHVQDSGMLYSVSTLTYAKTYESHHPKLIKCGTISWQAHVNLYADSDFVLYTRAIKDLFIVVRHV